MGGSASGGVGRPPQTLQDTVNKRAVSILLECILFLLVIAEIFITTHAGLPLGLENLGKWEGIFQSGNFEQPGKAGENHTKYWKTKGISDNCYLLFCNEVCIIC